MEELRLNPHEQMVCPGCDEKLRWLSSEYAVAGKEGKASRLRHVCEHCEFRFFAERESDGWIKVTKR